MKQRRYHPDPGRGVSGMMAEFRFSESARAAVVAILGTGRAEPLLAVAEAEAAHLVAADNSGDRPAPDVLGSEIAELADLARALRARLAGLHDQSASLVFEGYVTAHGHAPAGAFPTDPALLSYLDGMARSCDAAAAEFKPKAHRHHPDPDGLAFVLQISREAQGLGVTLSASPAARLVRLVELLLAEVGREGKGRSLVKSAVERLNAGTL